MFERYSGSTTVVLYKIECIHLHEIQVCETCELMLPDVEYENVHLQLFIIEFPLESLERFVLPQKKNCQKNIYFRQHLRISERPSITGVFNIVRSSVHEARRVLTIRMPTSYQVDNKNNCLVRLQTPLT